MPVIPRTIAEITISTIIGKKLLYMVVIDQKEKPFMAVKSEPNIAPVINPSVTFSVFDQLRIRVSRSEKSRVDTIIDHQIISPIGLLAHWFVLAI